MYRIAPFSDFLFSTLVLHHMWRIRACLKSLACRSSACQAADEELDDGDDGHRGRDLDQPLEVLGEAAVAAEPGEAALDHPAPWQDLEAAEVRRSSHDLQRE